jgi:Response regulator containing a CheY-like receiver domain and an HTH DNA-binding domain
MPERLRIFIADDDDFFLGAMQLIIREAEGMEVAGTARNGAEALRKIPETKPDLVLMDIKMPKMNGIEAIKLLKRDDPDLTIVILSTFNEEEYIIEGLAYGASGYFIKGTDYRKLIATIRDISRGQFILPVEVAAKLAQFTRRQISQEKKALPAHVTAGNTFTNKECEVMTLLSQRYSHKEIAQKLFISEGTLRNYLSIIYAKLGVRNRNEAIELLTKPEA